MAVIVLFDGVILFLLLFVCLCGSYTLMNGQQVFYTSSKKWIVIVEHCVSSVVMSAVIG
jgi:hypothetical protein